MTPELSKQARADAIASLQRCCRENFSEPLGDLAAALLLNFFLREIAPAIYNRAIADEFTYWMDIDKRKRP